ncbi:MAG: hypothetical protein J2P58_07130 [Acidimicrobiaceae bacterium]|nr:hypothetical protein [Acidimicrobiaceae bacterium]MBO0748526.1 hypothetical protein [Acidimicrobiaceae bacterium]
MAQDFDVDAMIERFRARARAVRQRGLPPVEGADRKRFIDQARIDFMDYAMIGDAEGKLVDGVLTLTVDLRPKTDGGTAPEASSPSDDEE